MRYLKGTKDYGIYYKRYGKFELRAYIDVDWAENIDDIKSTSGGAFFLRKRLVSWTSKKHIYISQSTTKAKYVVVAMNYTNVVWIN